MTDPRPETQPRKAARCGRPAGAKNIERPAVIERPAGCSSCGSTEREFLRIAAEEPIAGVLPAPFDHVYTHIVWRNVRCRACGQHYRLICYEHRAAGKNGGGK